MPRCQKDKWDSGSLLETELVRNRKNILSRNSNILSIATLGLVTDDLVRFAQTVPAVAAIIADSAAYSGRDQNFLPFGVSADEATDFCDFS
jgi:hypothetical protein